jgi:retron-type reverse transcriptase
MRRVDIPKPKGGTRPLGIATVEDSVVLTSMKLVLDPKQSLKPGDTIQPVEHPEHMNCN